MNPRKTEDTDISLKCFGDQTVRPGTTGFLKCDTLTGEAGEGIAVGPSWAL